MAINVPVYTTREIMKRALEVGETARINTNIDRAIESASRMVEGLCHRVFYPRAETKFFDWPNEQGALPWRLWLDDADLISAQVVSSGGKVIPPSDYYLEPNRSGPPYNRLEVSLSSPSAFGGGSTHQQDISISGVWGYHDLHMNVGVTTEALDAVETSIDVDGAASAVIGVGSIVRIDDERMLVTERALLDTGQDVAVNIGTLKSDTIIQVADGTQFAVDETLMIDAERVLILDVAGNNLIVQRAYDGSVLAAHTAGADIFAARTLRVQRGALGTTAATHALGAAVERWEVPSGIETLALAETIHVLHQEQTGWFRTMSASSNFGGTARRAATIEALVNQREYVYAQYGRKARTRTI